MNLRDQIAITALSSMLRHPRTKNPQETEDANVEHIWARQAYKLADAMMSEREKNRE